MRPLMLARSEISLMELFLDFYFILFYTIDQFSDALNFLCSQEMKEQKYQQFHYP